MNQKIENILKQFENLPRFEDGRIDYTNSNKAPVITCFVMYDKKLLLLKRSDKVNAYKGKWNAIAGFIDEIVPLEKKIYEELEEELGIDKKHVSEIKVKEHFELYDEKINKTWIIFPVLALLKKEPEIKIDWEHTDYRWINPEEIKNYDVVPGLDENLKRALL